MSILIVTVSTTGYIDESNVAVGYQWVAGGMSAAGGNIFAIPSTASELNSAIFDDAVQQAASNGITIGPSDRKLMSGGFL